MAYPWPVATDPIDLMNGLRAAVERARRSLTATGELSPQRAGRSGSPVPPQLREAVERVLTDGTYAKAAAAVAVEDPDLADL